MDNTLILRSKPEINSIYRNMDLYDTSPLSDFYDIDKDININLEHNIKILIVTLFIYVSCFICCYILQQRK